MPTVLKQVFTDIIKENFYPDGSFLKELSSFDHLVDNNKINMSQVGADPTVVENNSNFPLTPATRTDTGIEIALGTLDSEPTYVTNVEELETAYDKCQSVVRQHYKALSARAAKSAAFNIAPAENSTNTPVIATTGQANDGKKRLTYKDVLKLRTKFNKLNLPQDGRVLVLCPEHEEDLLAEDVDRYNQIITTGKIAGFKVYTFSDNPQYNTSGEKQAYGTTNAQPTSIAFVNDEVMRAMGSIEGEPEKRWADYRGWLIGFQMRFVAMPITGRGIAAIYSANA